MVSNLIAGVSLGAIYALIALGPSMVYGLLRMLDVGNIVAFVLAAYLARAVYTAVGAWWIGLLVGMAAGGLLGWAVQRLLHRPMLGQSVIAPLIASVGLFIAAEEVFRLVFGPYVLHFSPGIGSATVHIAGTVVTALQVVAIVVGLVVLAGTWYLVRHTTTGLRLRVTAQDREIAEAMGVRTDAVIARTFIGGYALAALAGVLVAINYDSITPTMGDVPAYKMLAIIVLGGLGNPIGTFVGALIIGIAETLVGVYSNFAIPRDTIAFLLLIVMLLVRPQGLMPRDVAHA